MRYFLRRGIFNSFNIYDADDLPTRDKRHLPFYDNDVTKLRGFVRWTPEVPEIIDGHIDPAVNAAINAEIDEYLKKYPEEPEDEFAYVI